MLQHERRSTGMTRAFRRKLVVIGGSATLVAHLGVLLLRSPENPLGALFLTLAFVGCICWLFLLSYALYDTGLFRLHPDERQQRVRNRVYSLTYRVTVGLLLLVCLDLAVFQSGIRLLFPDAYATGALSLTDVALFLAALCELVLALPVVLAAWLEPDPVADEPPRVSRKEIGHAE